MVAPSRPRKPQTVRAWISQRRRYHGSSASASTSQSVRYRAWPSDSTPMALHSARQLRARAARLPTTDRHVTPSTREMRRAMVTIPARPARKTTAITIRPMVWISSLGIQAKSARVVPSCGPWDAYMNAAKKAARIKAIPVPITGMVYMARARPVWSYEAMA